ncbi:DUF305 domain-containing protein [Streptomyces bobili]|uniref:DUF305 domain-containing protein n=1 Tax=Streptomyces bobili TaxID=67280 RepID=UPI0036FD0A99
MTAFTHALPRKPVRRAIAVGLVAAGALFLSACGDDGDDMSGMEHGSGNSSTSASASASPSASATTEPGSTAFNDADVAFAQMMIPHHQQALAMARLADGRTSDSEVKELAAKIAQAQGPEIRTMQGWLKSWNQPTATGSMPGMDHGSGDGMMSDGDMEHLKGMNGADFDRMFADMMIEHHNGAITMAEGERKNGEYAGAVKMAGAIVEGQSAEVKQLQSILDRL